MSAFILFSIEANYWRIDHQVKTEFKSFPYKIIIQGLQNVEKALNNMIKSATLLILNSWNILIIVYLHNLNYIYIIIVTGHHSIVYHLAFDMITPFTYLKLLNY